MYIKTLVPGQMARYFYACLDGATNYEFHLEHMEQPFDMFYSIAFERFELDSRHIKYCVQESLKSLKSLTWIFGLNVFE